MSLLTRHETLDAVQDVIELGESEYPLDPHVVEAALDSTAALATDLRQPLWGEVALDVEVQDVAARGGAIGGEREGQLRLAAVWRAEDLVDVTRLEAGAAHEAVDASHATADAKGAFRRKEIYGALWFGTKSAKNYPVLSQESSLSFHFKVTSEPNPHGCSRCLPRRTRRQN